MANFIGVANLLPGVMGQVNGSHATITVAGNRPIYVPSGEWRFKPGTPATVMIRPERLRLANQEPMGETGIQVKVRHAVFQGPVIRCSLNALDGTEIVAHVGPEDSVTGLEPGQTLWASWDPDAARLLPPAGYRGNDEPDLRTTVERAIP